MLASLEAERVGQEIRSTDVTIASRAAGLVTVTELVEVHCVVEVVTSRLVAPRIRIGVATTGVTDGVSDLSKGIGAVIAVVVLLVGRGDVLRLHRTGDSAGRRRVVHDRMATLAEIVIGVRKANRVSQLMRDNRPQEIRGPSARCYYRTAPNRLSKNLYSNDGFQPQTVR